MIVNMRPKEALKSVESAAIRLITSAYLTFICLMGDERIVLNLWAKKWTNLLIDEHEEKNKTHLKAKSPDEAVNLFLTILSEFGYAHVTRDFKVAKIEKGLLVELYSCPFDMTERIVIKKKVKNIGFSGNVEMGCWRAINLIAAIERISEEKIPQITYTISPKHITGNSCCKIEMIFRK